MKQLSHIKNVKVMYLKETALSIVDSGMLPSGWADLRHSRQLASCSVDDNNI
jgi:hypothetical protein